MRPTLTHISVPPGPRLPLVIVQVDHIGPRSRNITLRDSHPLGPTLSRKAYYDT